MPNQNPSSIVFAIGVVAGGFAGLATRSYAVNRNGEGANNLDIVISVDSFVVAATLAFCVCLFLNESRGISEENRRRAEEALRSTHERSSLLCNVLEKIAKADSLSDLQRILISLTENPALLAETELESQKVEEILKSLKSAFTCRTDMLTIEDFRMLTNNDPRVFSVDLRGHDVATFLVKCAKDFLELNFDGEGNQDETRESIREFVKKVQQPSNAGVRLAFVLGIAPPTSPASSSSSFEGRLV